MWERVHHLIRALEAGGEGAAAELVTKLTQKDAGAPEVPRVFAYGLYTLCERKKRAAEALSYNGLVQSWPEITRLARKGGKPAGPHIRICGERERGGFRTMKNETIQEALKCLADTVPAGSQVILFGSQARGDARPDSDLDVLVVEPEVRDRGAEMVRLSALLGQKLIPADVVVMSRSAFERLREVPNTLPYRASREGRTHEPLR